MWEKLSDMDIQGWRHYNLIRKENTLLVSAGFEPAEGGLWRKEGVWFSRGAALQQLRQSDDSSRREEGRG